ncbi:hypothetical protein GPA25_14430 [Aromatoleum diolicum]|uniref:Chalcone isomerase domain-containing protein n=2 Tax=Aromatoleum diolicum TaxID=75796 RepID=A0ABX1QF16_9RHOO|nr:hypothetical protein [Aromatoleum diolicum]
MLPLPTALASGMPDVLASEAADWRQLGRGEMRWFGLRIYEAALWVRGDGRWRDDRPFALEIRYARDIPSARLVETSIDEMRRLGVADAAQLARWQVDLERAFPAVSAGDVIVGVHRPGAGAAFYHRGRLTTEVRDVAFAAAFFAIWLDARTREPALRTRLLGDGREG